MEIRIRTKNMTLTGHLEDYTREKLLKVNKFLSFLTEGADNESLHPAVEMDIEIEKITKGQNKGEVYRVEAQMFLPGASLRAEDTSNTPKEAVSEVRYELQRQVKSYKEKHNSLRKKAGREVKEIREKKEI